MATDAVIDINALIQPVSAENPQGEDIRQDFTSSSIYYRIKDARAAARTAERQRMMHQGEDNNAENLLQMVPEWKTVLDVAPKILVERSKDLEVAAWYCEALLRAYGFAGLRDGFALIKALTEKYWDGLYPLPDEDGLETRVASLTGLNGDDSEGTLITPIRQVALTEGFNESPFAAWQYEQAFDVESIQDPEKKAAKLDSGAISMKAIEQAVAETSPLFFINLKDDLDKCLEVFVALGKVLDQQCGDAAPPSSNIRNALKRELEILSFMTKNIVLEEPETEAQTEIGETAVASATTKSVTKGASIDSMSVASRDEAFRALKKVSEFFKKTEPHSPISYNLEQAVKWGHMTLPELLKELIPDERARTEYFRLVGIKETQE